MRSISSIIIILCLSLFFTNCKTSEEKQKQKSLELLSARTVGLAYLEENKLEEAEKEFLKFIDLSPKEKLGYANLGIVYLRMGRYEDAEKNLKKALKIDPKDPDVKLILATVYETTDRKEMAISELKESLKFTPNHIKTLYNLSELYATSNDSNSIKQRESFLTRVVENAPANIVPRLNLAEIFIKNGNSVKALEQLEEIIKIFPEFPKEAVEYYDKTISSLHNSDTENALTPFIIFHNYLKVSSPYQAGIMDLKGPGGSLIGFPVITFDQQITAQSDSSSSILEAISFTDITSSAGLEILNTEENSKINDNTSIAINDFDGDGDIDIYAGSSDSKTPPYLFKSDMGKYIEVAKESGIKHSGKEYFSKFDDYDNDGFPDLFIIKEGKNILYRNTGKGTFEDVTKKANLDMETGGNNCLSFDYDHDGDLDLFIGKTGKNLIFRNNGDGTFEDAVNIFPGDENTVTRDASFGDFDEDGDIDLLVVNQNSENILYSNLRQSQFKNITNEAGLSNDKNSTCVSVGDYNNDGFLDLFIGSEVEKPELYINSGDGKFINDKNSNKIFKEAENTKIYSSTFLDFDNDGSLDLLIAGESKEKEGKGIFLFHNNGVDSYDDVSYLLPESLTSGKQILTFDYNLDGDIDILVTTSKGVKLIRNDGGNTNHFVKIKLVGLRTGSAKNNYFGIGAKVEMRAGDLYQTKVVTDPNVIFGLGKRLKSDIIRITWTNGVPQNIFFPGTDQSIVETQVLKGSCPFLYAWNGEKYEFVKDILWRSALGMPLGIMGGTTKYAFADASDDYIKIPGKALVPKNEKYSIRITSELWETIYLDNLKLIAVDHPDSIIDIFVDETFTPPPFPGYVVYPVTKKHSPVSAIDGRGNNLLPLITEKDDKYISNFRLDKYQGTTEMKDLILDLGTIKSDNNLYLFLSGWIFPSDASINVAMSQSDQIKPLTELQVINKIGEWETVIENIGFPMGKDKTMVISLEDKFISGISKIRIRSNMQIYWDQIFYSFCNEQTKLPFYKLSPETANLQYRGFSSEYRKGGQYGPHWFDYNDITRETKWRDLTGFYTRYGDVLPLLQESESKYVIMNAGDEILVEFNAKELPALKKGWKRDFILYNVGWVKDGDINTATGNTVDPLPFHGMTQYPYGKDEQYPDDPSYRQYINEYNTRKVSDENYKNQIKPLNKAVNN